MRFIIFIILAYICYTFLKSWFSNFSKKTKGSDYEKIDDIMVLDPCCKVYIPKNEAIVSKFKGEKIYFCSKECKKQFFKENK
jgi:uncharacterized protein